MHGPRRRKRIGPMLLQDSAAPQNPETLLAPRRASISTRSGNRCSEIEDRLPALPSPQGFQAGFGLFSGSHQCMLGDSSFSLSQRENLRRRLLYPLTVHSIWGICLLDAIAGADPFFRCVIDDEQDVCRRRQDAWEKLFGNAGLSGHEGNSISDACLDQIRRCCGTLAVSFVAGRCG